MHFVLTAYWVELFIPKKHPQSHSERKQEQPITTRYEFFWQVPFIVRTLCFFHMGCFECNCPAESNRGIIHQNKRQWRKWEQLITSFLWYHHLFVINKGQILDFWGGKNGLLWNTSELPTHFGIQSLKSLEGMGWCLQRCVQTKQIRNYGMLAA